MKDKYLLSLLEIKLSYVFSSIFKKSIADEATQMSHLTCNKNITTFTLQREKLKFQENICNKKKFTSQILRSQEKISGVNSFQHKSVHLLL